MRLLLDTVTFLWLAAGDSRLSAAAVNAHRDPSNEVFFSAVSAWEIAVKHVLGKLPLPEEPSRCIPRYRQQLRAGSLPLSEDSALALTRLPRHHADPFDRMLVAQAIVGGMTLVTPDTAIHAYPVVTLW